ncbi:EAL domain-containing protein [Heliobacterium gestii]|uniref:EAL domain-containing protein n=1 Tax=Heliomicrobium gestii TaxID=2699 RepID=A0A845L8P3_HELGE|nr:EAL domain-containing protein [Heliomicrobium gestii]MBM7865712.1 EAL domain-containing protein (putative c-di-GMP-specific phosphodiesterase class I) [Heliomicrobium gestii]MZP41961.1 EAL domain-containing protein [Heliomicrobium gestii]
MNLPRFFPDPATVMPHFQPILSMDTQTIYAYEVLGRYSGPHGVRSLGPFFHDPSVSMDEHIFIDRIIRQKAIASLVNAPENTRLFLNLKPNWIYNYRARPDQLPTLRFLREHNVDPSRITVEITEDAFLDDIEELARVTRTYREAGCQIAIDDVGSGFVNFDRIAYIKPNILKLDLELVKKCGRESFFREILFSFAVMAEKIGAFLLFEGIETKEEVQIALSLGARYLQGYFFSPPQATMQNPNAFRSGLNHEIQQFVDHALWQQHADQRDAEEMRDNLLACLPRLGEGERITLDACDVLIDPFLKQLPRTVIRVFLCDERGYQWSSNFTRQNGQWEKNGSFIGRNWAWRPYFLNNIVKATYQEAGKLSAVYTDAHTGEKMRTYIYPIPENLFLCLDLTIES